MESVVTLRQRVLRQGVPIRQVARELGVSRNTVRRYLREEVEIGARKATARASPVLERVEGRAREILADARKWTGGKQRLTAAKLHALLEQEGVRVGSTTVKRIVREWRRERAEVFVPLTYRPGELAEVDFFEVLVDVRGVRRKAWMFVMRLMYSGRDFAWLYDRQDQVAFLEGHVRAFAHFGGVVARIIYDNLRAAVSRILCGSERKLTERFKALVAHYAFEPCFARPYTGHDKGGVESGGRAIRLRDLVPIPSGDSLDELSSGLLARLDSRLDSVRDAEGRLVREKFADEAERMLALPAFAFRPERTKICQVSARSLVSIEGAHYSVPREWARLDVTAHVGATEVEFVGRTGSVRHPRMRFGQRSIDYRHYLPDLAAKPQALRQVAPELIATLGEPFATAWGMLQDSLGPKDGARAFAEVLRHVIEHGYEATAQRLRIGVHRGESLLLALRATEEPPSTLELPPAFASILVESSSVHHFDALLEATA